MGLLDTLFSTGQSEARRLNLQNMDFIRSLFTEGVGGRPGALDYILQSGQQGLQPARQAVQVAQQGQADANRFAAAQGAQSYRAIQDLAKQGASAAGQGAASSGFSGGTAGTGARSQAFYQAGRSAGQLGEGLARTSASTALQGSARTSQALQGLAAYYANRGGQFANASGNLGSLMSQFQFQGGEAPINALLGVAGMALGGPLGGAIGGALGGALGGGGGAQTGLAALPDILLNDTGLSSMLSPEQAYALLSNAAAGSPWIHSPLAGG